MKILKFIMWPILILSLLWTGAIFFGPLLIAKSASYFSDGIINLRRVEVSPKLKMSAAAVDFYFPTMARGRDSNVTSRAVTIDWTIKNGFELIGKIGPSNSPALGTLASANFTLKPASAFDWSEVSLQLEFQQLAGKNFNLIQGDLVGKLTNRFTVLKNIELNLPKVRGKFSGIFFEASGFSALADQYKIFQQPLNQKSEVEYNLENLSVPEGAFEASLVRGNVKLSNGEVNFKVSGSEAKLAIQKIKAKSFTVVTSKPLSTNRLEGGLEFSILDAQLETPATKVKNYSGNLLISSSSLIHNGRAVITKLELKNDQYFLGEIEDGILDVALKVSALPSGIEVGGQAIVTLERLDAFNANLNVKSLLLNESLIGCLYQKCRIRRLKADYTIGLSGSNLNGNFNCEKDDCFGRPTKHVIRTDNTTKFFQELSNIGILSPLSLPIAYLAISGGEGVGDGHVLKY